MYHFFVEPFQIDEEQEYIEILGGDVNHIENVLRMKQGEELTVSDGFGSEYRCSAQEFLPETVKVKILEKSRVSSELVASKRCVVRLDEKKAQSKVKRWQAIAESAAKQSGRAVVPEVKLPVSYREAMKLSEELDVKLIPYECADELLSGTEETPMERTRNRLKTILPGQSIGIMIGPEGGLEKAEVEQSMEAGFAPVTLGKRILRTETAGLCILSVLMFQLEE